MIKKLLTTTLILAFLCGQAFAADPKAKRILIDDTALNFTAENVEDALAELKTTGAASARQSISETITGISYDNTTGIFSTTAGYVIPTTTEESNWNTAYGWGNHASAGYLTSYIETDPQFDTKFSAKTTANLTENTNLYYTDARARGAVSETVTGLDYSNTTGVLSQTTGYVIPTTTEESNWNATTTTVNLFNSNAGLIKSDGGGGYFFITDNSSNWNTAYGWGNHASAGYLTSASIDTSSELATILTDETGTLKAVFSDSPAFTTKISTPLTETLVDSNTIYTGIKLQNPNLGTTARIKASFWGATAVADATPIEKGYFEHIGINSSTTLDGVAAADSINFASLASKLFIWQSGNFPIEFFTNNNERMRIDGTGQVNIIDGPLVSPTFVSNNADPADAGIIRLGNAEYIEWEASPASTDIFLGVNSSEQLELGGGNASFSILTTNPTPIAMNRQSGGTNCNISYTNTTPATLYAGIGTGDDWFIGTTADTASTQLFAVYHGGGSGSTYNNLTTTNYANGLKIMNSTAATSGVTIQNSPALVLSGRSWVASADTEYQWGLMDSPSTGGYSFLNIGYKAGAAAWATKFTLTDVGTIDTNNEFRANPGGGETITERTGLVNASAATATLDQFSPYFKYYGSGWKSAATAGTQNMTYASVMAPEQGVTNPIGVFKGFYGTNTTTPVITNELFRYEWGDNNAIGLLGSTTPTASAVQINGDEVLAKQSSLGAEKTTNGTFTGSASSWTLGTGFAYSANTVVKNADGLGTVSQTSAAMATPLVAGDYYLLQFTISSMTVNDNIIVTCGGATLRAVTANNGTYTLTFKATSTADLVLTPTVTTSRYTLDTITLKKITGGDLTVLGSIILQNGETVTNGTNGRITFAGSGGTNNEDLSLDFESASNQVGLSSSTGISYFNFSTLAPVTNADVSWLFKNSSADMQMQWDTTEGNDSFKIGTTVGSSTNSGNIMIVEAADINVNFGVPTVANPTLRIQSADATTTSDFIEFYHNQTDPIIQFGNGILTILDPNSNEVLKANYVASAVNELSIVNAPTGANPGLSATGSDTNIGITIMPKGTGGVVIGGAIPADMLAGDFGYDTTQKAFKQGIAGGADAYVQGTLFSQTADGTWTGTTEATILGTGVGSLTLPANFWTVGKTIKIHTAGYYTTVVGDGSNAATIKLKHGSVALWTGSVDDAANNTNKKFYIDSIITCRSTGATGTLMAQVTIFDPLNYFLVYGETVNTTTSTVDTTASAALDITWTQVDTGNTIKTTNTIVEVLN